MTDTAAQTPLVELLASVPEDARMSYEISPTEHQNIPVGRLCHEAAEELARLRAQNEHLRRVNMGKVSQTLHDDAMQELREGIERAERALAEARVLAVAGDAPGLAAIRRALSTVQPAPPNFYSVLQWGPCDPTSAPVYYIPSPKVTC